jgi:hypothetical protein
MLGTVSRKDLTCKHQVESRIDWSIGGVLSKCIRAGSFKGHQFSGSRFWWKHFNVENFKGASPMVLAQAYFGVGEFQKGIQMVIVLGASQCNSVD